MMAGNDKREEKVERYFTVRKSPEYADLVHPRLSSRMPFDGWFDLKEAYSSKLVETLLKETKNEQDAIVIDPFCGSGTTLVGARNAFALKGIGIEINPFFQLLEKVKMTPVDPGVTRHFLSNISRTVKDSKKIIDIPGLEIIEKVFGDNLQPILRAREEIKKIPDENTRDFAMAGLGCILEKVSTSKKDGNGLKYPENKKPLDVHDSLAMQYKRMLIDVTMLRRKRFDYEIVKGDCRNVEIKDRNVTRCIFSPPYANCFDYTEVYKIELWTLGFVDGYDQMKTLREKSLSSHMNKQYNVVKSPRKEIDENLDLVNWEKTWGKIKTKYMISSYFNDMKRVFFNMNNVMINGGILYCIVGNSAYGGIVIPTDVFLSMILEDCGFSVEEIRFARKLKTSPQQFKNLKYNEYLRESIIVAKKK